MPCYPVKNHILLKDRVIVPQKIIYREKTNNTSWNKLLLHQFKWYIVKIFHFSYYIMIKYTNFKSKIAALFLWPFGALYEMDSFKQIKGLDWWKSGCLTDGIMGCMWYYCGFKDRYQKAGYVIRENPYQLVNPVNSPVFHSSLHVTLVMHLRI